MKRLAITIVAIGALAAACESGGPSSLGRAPGGGSTTSRNASPSTTPTTTTVAAPEGTTPTRSAPPTTAPAPGPIVVLSPIGGSRVSSPVTISGNADVYEATVNARILDAGGNEIAVSFTTASCGSGCRGDYTLSMPFSVDAEQDGTIEVLNYSPRDGSPENVVRIPVTLAPAGTGANPEEAVGAWVRSQGHAYAGDCAATTVPADAGKYCSALGDDGTDRKTYGIGPVAAEFTTDLTVELRGTTWVVTSAEDVPQPGA